MMHINEEKELQPRSDSNDDKLTLYSFIWANSPFSFDKNYTLQVKQTLEGSTFTRTATIRCHEPRFSIPSEWVMHRHPPPHRSGVYRLYLPHIALSQPDLPWMFSPSSSLTTKSPPTMVLLTLKPEELALPHALAHHPTSATGSITLSMQDSLQPTIQHIQHPQVTLHPTEQDLPTQHIYIKKNTYTTLCPAASHLSYLVHCRKKGSETYAILMSDRFPEVGQSDSSETQGHQSHAVRYHVHLVSLLGLPPFKLFLQDAEYIHLVSLNSWSFISQPQKGESFSEAMASITKHATHPLRLPVTSNIPHAKPYLQDGYVPLPYFSINGTVNLGFYRGPFTPSPQLSLDLHDPSMTPSTIQAASGLMSYNKNLGVFNLTYAAAWQLGRSLGLSTPIFSEHLLQWRAQRRHSVPQPPSAQEHMLQALSRGWLDRCTQITSTHHSSAEHAHALTMVREAAQEALLMQRSNSRQDHSELTILPWLRQLWSLDLCPFVYLVPDLKLLPPESIRFFYIDHNWLRYLVMGALSLGIHDPHDLQENDQLFREVIGQLEPDNAIHYGFLFHSQLVSHWPKLIIEASSSSTSLRPVKQTRLGEDTMMIVFNITTVCFPLTITIAQPHVHMSMGVHDDTNIQKYIFYRDPSDSSTWQSDHKINVQVHVKNRLDIHQLLLQLEQKLTYKPMPCQVALQLIRLPERVQFTAQPAHTSDTRVFAQISRHVTTSTDVSSQSFFKETMMLPISNTATESEYKPLNTPPPIVQESLNFTATIGMFDAQISPSIVDTDAKEDISITITANSSSQPVNVSKLEFSFATGSKSSDFIPKGSSHSIIVMPPMGWKSTTSSNPFEIQPSQAGGLSIDSITVTFQNVQVNNLTGVTSIKVAYQDTNLLKHQGTLSCAKKSPGNIPQIINFYINDKDHIAISSATYGSPLSCHWLTWEPQNLNVGWSVDWKGNSHPVQVTSGQWGEYPSANHADSAPILHENTTFTLKGAYNTPSGDNTLIAKQWTVDVIQVQIQAFYFGIASISNYSKMHSLHYAIKDSRFFGGIFGVAWDIFIAPHLQQSTTWTLYGIDRDKKKQVIEVLGHLSSGQGNRFFREYYPYSKNMVFELKATSAVFPPVSKQWSVTTIDYCDTFTVTTLNTSSPVVKIEIPSNSDLPATIAAFQSGALPESLGAEIYNSFHQGYCSLLKLQFTWAINQPEKWQLKQLTVAPGHGGSLFCIGPNLYPNGLFTSHALKGNHTVNILPYSSTYQVFATYTFSFDTTLEGFATGQSQQHNVDTTFSVGGTDIVCHFLNTNSGLYMNPDSCQHVAHVSISPASSAINLWHAAHQTRREQPHSSTSSPLTQFGLFAHRLQALNVAGQDPQAQPQVSEHKKEEPPSFPLT